VQELWTQIQAELETAVDAADYASWLAPLQAMRLNDTELNVGVPTQFMLDWVVENYQDIFNTAVSKAAGKDMAVTFCVVPISMASEKPKLPDDFLPEKKEPTPEEGIEAQLLGGTALNPLSTFKAFVTGNSNAVAYAAASRIAEAVCAGEVAAYNPFFLHGGVGLGKTHLMHAVGWEILAKNDKLKVLYISAEQFLFRFIRALQSKSTLNFKETFRNVDVLMIDDVQFIAGKGATQEEFFHTFNTLVGMGKQVILTSDRSPHDLDKVEERLKSRLGSGLTCEVHAPEVETRLAILEQKAALLGLELAPDVIEFMAQNIVSNVRELEGALNRLAAHAKFVGATITLEFAQEQLKDLFRSQAKGVTLEDIQRQVAEFYTIKIADLHGPRRQRQIARPRQVAMYLCKKLTTRSFPEIGRAFGGRDHTTVMHGTKAVEKLLVSDSTLAEEVRLLERALG